MREKDCRLVVNGKWGWLESRSGSFQDYKNFFSLCQSLNPEPSSP